MENGAKDASSSVSTDTQINEDLADRIQQEWVFKVKRTVAAILTRVGLVKIVLLLMQIRLIVSNNYYSFGSWKWFITKSIQYRDGVTGASLGRAAHLDSSLLDPYSLWLGWVMPSFLASSTYMIVALVSLRHELYHWKPELLARYFKISEASKIAQYVPAKWLQFVFHVYQDRHRKNVFKNIQKRTHFALEDSSEFIKVLQTVAVNNLVSYIVILVFWGFLLRTKVESGSNVVKLPKSYVPPIQILIWYLFNDFFYFYPHWIAHHGPSTDTFYYKVLPMPVAKALYTYLNQAHKLHHRTKANLGIAAWYCSPWEQILFNLIPTLIGPYATQVLADAFHLEQTWGTHLVTLYAWLMAASAASVLAHTGFRSWLNDPGEHDLHHERAFDPKAAVNFGTLGLFDYLHGTSSSIPEDDAKAWRDQRDRQAALYEASRRSGVALSMEQMEVVKQPDHGVEWVDKTI